MGPVPVGIAVAVACVNLRMAAKWDANKKPREAARRRGGRPAKQPTARHQEVIARAAGLLLARE